MSQPHDPIDQHWADLLSPGRRQLLRAGGLAAAGGLIGAPAFAAALPSSPAAIAAHTGKSPWGYATATEPTPRPLAVRPGEEHGLPDRPRAYTDIKSYHAHIYFDEDSYEKAVRIRQWTAERFAVELGNWNAKPRGPHVTPSFYFGFGTDLQPLILPWLQLNSLGLTILVHPNTDDPRADHLHYALWVNRSQPVNAYGMKKPDLAAGEPAVEQIYPNTRPTVAIERS
ncbi:DOPA 4,5-dioxygenase family protein [Sphingobium yanoikuyae]|uniref:DOPA 4,5-dioxygenase family protein n=1 Tax=Sphingobium yanoikuyae TaxID=13690 RepID=A0A6M4G711_SPHYA|nr:DOPA 4,5-dioxygenase family protein [Sphingobium yanoikuyae]QJR02929.1 DOPA 4,5-dioxygenase family protein [Sphingobium yanoikuyae]